MAISARGHFISFEGGEGSGKSTQARLLAEHMAAQGIPCLHTREPGGTPEGEQLRAWLVTGEANRWTPMAEALLFQALRVQHLTTRIEPALAAGTHVICDRFVDSTRVYQGISKGLGVALIDALHAQSAGGILPDHTFLLDISPEAGLQRAAGRGGEETRFESASLDFHRTLRAGFLALAEAEPKRILVLDATESEAALHAQILSHLAFLR